MPGMGVSGGAERSYRATVPALIERGHDLHLVLLTERRVGVEELQDLGVTVHDLSAHRGTLGRARAIRRLTAQLEPDVVQASLYEAVVPTQLGLRGAGVPVLVTWTAIPYDAERRGEHGLTAWRLDAVRRIEAMLARWCPSDYQAVTAGVGRSYGASIGVRPERIHVAERGREAAPPPDPERRAATRAALGLAEGDTMVVAIARQEPRKGLHRVVEPFDRVVDAVPGAHLVVAGAAGPATEALTAAVAAQRHPGHVHLLGHRDDVGELLAAADAFVLTSLSEGAAGAAIEAMTHALPIVSARLTGLDGVLVDGENALVVDGDQAGSFVAPLVAIATDGDLAARLGAAALATFEERFTIERSVDALEALYRSLAYAPDRWERTG